MDIESWKKTDRIKVRKRYFLFGPRIRLRQWVAREHFICGQSSLSMTRTHKIWQEEDEVNMSIQSTNNYEVPDKGMLDDPVFNAIWNEIKSWDINVPEEYEGYCGATGNHAAAILRAIRNNETE